MKKAKKEFDWRTIYNKGRNVDDGSLITIRPAVPTGRKKRRILNYILIHVKLLERFGSRCRKVEIMYSKGYLGFRFYQENEKKSNVYYLHKISKIKYQFSCRFIKKIKGKKYFEKDLIWDEKNKIIVIKVKLKKGAKIDSWDFMQE